MILRKWHYYKKIIQLFVDIFGKMRIIAFVWIREKIVKYRSTAYCKIN